VSRKIVSENGVAAGVGFPTLSLNQTYTVFVPSPVVNVHALDVAYASHAEQEVVLLMHICDTPLASDADKVNVTGKVELVYVALPFIVTDPAGGVVSVAACVVTLNVSLTPPMVSVAFTAVE